MLKRIVHRWLPVLLMMLLIFWFSSQPSEQLPYFDRADRIVKKGSHMIGYGILAISYWHVFGYRTDRRWFAWLLAVLYAVTDEFHQSFVAGRNASVWDVVIFDNLGALISLWLGSFVEQKRPRRNA
jgi:VanZ family protein